MKLEIRQEGDKQIIVLDGSRFCRESRAKELESVCRIALEALQFNFGGEPFPTIELKAIEKLKQILIDC